MKRLDSVSGGIFSRRGLSLLCALFAVTVGAAPLSAAQAVPPIVGECRADLAKRLKLPQEEITLVEAAPGTWPDTALGMPVVGKMYAQVITPGHRITLKAKNTQYLYTASAKAFRYGGPVSSWSCSMLYLEPTPNEPNMNGDLYQCSLLGTNAGLVASGVSEYYPQEQGVVLFTRRTSRSGFDLLHVKADGKSKPVLLHSALAFGEAAFNSVGKRWAAIVRPGLGGGWTIACGGLASAGAKRMLTLPLPDGVSPERIAWSGDNLMILAKKGEKSICFEISPKAEKPEWNEVGYHLFPGFTDFVLNKSQSLGIEQVEKDDMPAVAIETVWFTGDRDPIAWIEGLTMRGTDFLIGLFAFVWGDKDGNPAVYSVNISTGEIITGPKGIGPNIKPLAWPPYKKPILRKNPS